MPVQYISTKKLRTGLLPRLPLGFFICRGRPWKEKGPWSRFRTVPLPCPLLVQRANRPPVRRALFPPSPSRVMDGADWELIDPLLHNVTLKRGGGLRTGSLEGFVLQCISSGAFYLLS
jgi:hypothetical protein